MILNAIDHAGIATQVKPAGDAWTQHLVSTGQPLEIHSLCTGEPRGELRETRAPRNSAVPNPV